VPHTCYAKVTVGIAAARIPRNVLVVADLLARGIEELEVGLLIPLVFRVQGSGFRS
jgi:hypothetical protein